MEARGRRGPHLSTGSEISRKGDGGPDLPHEAAGPGLSPAAGASARAGSERYPPAAMAFNWWKFLHLAGLVGFLVCHGVSMFVLYRIRNVDLDRAKDRASSSRSRVSPRLPMYISLLVIVVGGDRGRASRSKPFGQLWLWRRS